jgi:serine kinase of HPr protein (carbohydrate metabolism regulator)
VADDRTLVWVSGGRLYGRAPAPLAGLIEARGLGVLGEPALPLAEIVLAARCVEDPGKIDRIQEVRLEDLLGATLPSIMLHAREPSAPAKLRRAMQHLGGVPQQAYQAASRGGGGRAGAGDSA